MIFRLCVGLSFFGLQPEQEENLKSNGGKVKLNPLCIHKGKIKVAGNEKRKKLSGFSFSINIANFEAFCRTKKLISNLFFLKSDYLFVYSQK